MGGGSILAGIDPGEMTGGGGGGGLESTWIYLFPKLN